MFFLLSSFTIFLPYDYDDTGYTSQPQSNPSQRRGRHIHTGGNAGGVDESLQLGGNLILFVNHYLNSIIADRETFHSGNLADGVLTGRQAADGDYAVFSGHNLL